MGLLKLAFFASIIISVRGTPLDESKAWQYNDTANIANTTSSSESEVIWTIFAPVTMVSGFELDLPGDIATSSPVTQRTKLSLEVPETVKTGTPPQQSVTRTAAPKPIVQPSEGSLAIPIATVSNGKTYVTVAPSAHLEHSGTILVRPQGDTGSPTLGIVGSELVELPTNTGSAATHHDEDDSESSAGSNGDAPQHLPATILVGNTPLSAGGSPITVDGTTYSLEPTGSAIVVNGNTISFSTDSRGQAVPVETATNSQSGNDGNDADAKEALSQLSVVSAEATETGETGSAATRTGGPLGTTSATSTTTSGSSGSQGSSDSTGINDNDSNEGTRASGTDTSDGSAPAEQSDNAAAPVVAQWPIPAILGVVGLLAAVV